MEFIFDLIQSSNPQYGGLICPNKLLFRPSGSPMIGEDNQQYITIQYKVYFSGVIGEDENARTEHIIYREESHIVPFQLIALLPFVEQQKETINAFLSTLTFKGFLQGFVMQIP